MMSGFETSRDTIDGGREEKVDNFEPTIATDGADIDSQSSDTSSNDSEEEGEHGHKRRKNINYVLIVPRGDIRRMYAQMFVNVINSHSIPTIYSFFITYCSKDFRASHDFSTWNFHEINDTSNRVVYNSPLFIIMFFTLLFQFIPDQVIKLKVGIIHTSSTRSTTEISCDMQLDFSLLFEGNPMILSDDIIRFINVIDTSTKYHSSLNTPLENLRPPTPPPRLKGGKKCRKKMSQRTALAEPPDEFHVPNAIEYYQETMGQPLVLLGSPTEVTITFKTVFLIDPLRKLLSIDLLEPQQI